MSVNVTLFPLGQRVECELEITNNEMNTKQLQVVLKRAGLQWFRPGFTFHKKLPKPCEDTVNLASCLISLFRVRAEQSFWLASPAVRRLTKTLASCFAQHAELAIEKAMRRDCPDPCLESKYHPFTASSRRKGSKALQMVLIQRFAAKGGGFVTCKNEQSLQSLGVVQAGSSLATRTASEYCVRALCATANFCAEYIDNARLKVLSVILRLNGRHFSAPTQLLPSGADPEECVDAMKTFTEALKVAAGTPQGENVKVPPGSFSWKSYRQATKATLAGLSNSLRNCLPASWSFTKCLPPNVLSPAALHSDRISMIPLEKQMYGMDGSKNLFFNYCYKSFKSEPQFYLHENFHRLIFSADEGTEAHSDVQPFGFLGFLHLANSNLYVLMWPDIFHKINRRVAQALNHPECAELKLLLKQAMKLFRFSRAPFSTGRFGQMISEARVDLLRALKAGEMEELVDMWLSGVAKDRGLQVLADDSNQDKLRSVVICFKPLREYLGQVDADMQRKPTASVQHSVYLASGKSVQKLISRTVASATSRESLLFIGALCDDEEATDKLKLHSSLLLAILGALCDLDSNHRALPWRVSVAIDHTQLPSLLKFMEQEWFFVNAVIDTLDDKEPLWRLLSHTRWQVYRDCMTKGEHFGFSLARINSPAAAPFLDVVRIVLGLTSSDEKQSDSLLSSLHSELCFNDLRDACKRGSKKERQSPSNFHCVSMKSCARRSSGCLTVEVEDSDWQDPLPRKHIQSSVLSALRLTDRSLGIPTSGLTKCKAPLLTKPHVLSQRLGLLKCLQRIFEACGGSLEEKRDIALNAYHDLWLSKLVVEHTLIRVKNESEEFASHPDLVLTAGPFTILTIALTPASAHEPELYRLCTNTEEKIVTDLTKFELALCEPVVEEGTMSFRAKGEYLSLIDFTAQHGILTIAPGVLRSLMARMKIKKAGSLTHRLRVELFLQTEEEPGDEDWDRLDGQSEDEELGEMVNVVCGMCDEKDDDRQGDHEPVAERKPEPDVVPVEEPKDPVAEPETVRADAGKVNADQCARGRPEGEWPPGSKPYFGNPATSSPFVQCYLPQGFVFQGRKSKSLSFQEGPASTVRGICRSKEAAILGVQTWAWQWFNSLKKEDKSSLVETDALAERPAKKARVN
ncbi:unnamed protein product [Cladocopium goreaui]|uniref:Protein-S-isoprenylcysteine O-methyltransferase n=1 Tax=Cladocopium goreaui TaxID=2562237 RepID=A0A9P1CT18_9DINO|nr:unnamed protein product [Cladocopium goreaui]